MRKLKYLYHLIKLKHKGCPIRKLKQKDNLYFMYLPKAITENTLIVGNTTISEELYVCKGEIIDKPSLLNSATRTIHIRVETIIPNTNSLPYMMTYALHKHAYSNFKKGKFILFLDTTSGNRMVAKDVVLGTLYISTDKTCLVTQLFNFYLDSLRKIQKKPICNMLSNEKKIILIKQLKQLYANMKFKIDAI